MRIRKRAWRCLAAGIAMLGVVGCEESMEIRFLESFPEERRVMSFSPWEETLLDLDTGERVDALDRADVALAITFGVDVDPECSTVHIAEWFAEEEAVIRLGAVPFDDVVSIPDTGWRDRVLLREEVYIVRTDEGRFVKFEVLDNNVIWGGCTDQDWTITLQWILSDEDGGFPSPTRLEQRRRVPTPDVEGWSGMGDGFLGVGRSVRGSIQTDAGLFAFGSFVLSGSLPIGMLARWNGISWERHSSARFTTESSNTPSVRDAVVFRGDLVIAGTFDAVDGRDVTGLARWDGTGWSPLGEFSPPTVQCLLVHEDALVVAGKFQSVIADESPVEANGMARWDGNAWHAMDAGLEIGWAGFYDLAESHGALLAVGDLGGELENRVIQWSGERWEPKGSEVGRSFVLSSERGDLLIGGTFGVQIFRSGDWEPLGPDLDGEFSSSVWALAWHGGHLYAGGSFDYSGDTRLDNIARLDRSGSRPRWRAVHGGLDGAVNHIAVWNDGLVVGGYFGEAGGLPANGVAYYRPPE